MHPSTVTLRARIVHEALQPSLLHLAEVLSGPKSFPVIGSASGFDAASWKVTEKNHTHPIGTLHGVWPIGDGGLLGEVELWSGHSPTGHDRDDGAHLMMVAIALQDDVELRPIFRFKRTGGVMAEIEVGALVVVKAGTRRGVMDHD